MKRINCDVFMVDGSTLDETVCITGNFYAGNHCSASTINVDGNVFLGDFSSADSITATGDVSIGDYSEVPVIYAGGSVDIGCYSSTIEIEALEDISFGYGADFSFAHHGRKFKLDRKFKLLKFLKGFCREV